MLCSQGHQQPLIPKAKAVFAGMHNTTQQWDLADRWQDPQQKPQGTLAKAKGEWYCCYTS